MTLETGMVETLNLITHIFFTFTLGWYLITNLQWYNYKLDRVILKHHKYMWHIWYFMLPYIAYHFTGYYFNIFFYFAFFPSMIMWQRTLDKKLVLTWRVRRFLALLLSLTLFQDFICALKDSCMQYGVFMPLAMTIIGSFMMEKYMFLLYKTQAKKRLEKIQDLKIIAITGSFGKTSIKNFIAQILATKYSVYATPRSVNTMGGIIKDINENLPLDTQIYVVEAGAREKGDILEITQLINPHYAVVGVVGEAHIEYFKTLENIQRTKLELIQSNRLIKAFVHQSATNQPHPKVQFFGNEVQNLVSNLDGLTFTMQTDQDLLTLKTTILGDFQATNIIASVLMAKEFNLNNQEITKAVQKLYPIPHRLERINAGGKIILDDGFNGNLDGMLGAINLCKLHTSGKRIIVTPGLVESSADNNLKLINAIDENFDIAIITGALNLKIFEQHLRKTKVIIVPNKKELEGILAEYTGVGDIVLFANDAPNFI